MAPSVNFAVPHEYARVRSPRRISSNGWWSRRSEIATVVMRKKPEDEEREEMELLLMSKSTNAGMLHPRICANCRTSKTPLWRSGPTGPKSLCNACGIRFRKKQQEAGSSNNDPVTFFHPSWAVTGSPSHILTLDQMKALQKAKQLRILRFIARRRTQELRRLLLETSRREVMQAAQLLLSLSQGY